MNAPIPMEWTGEVMRPPKRYDWQCQRAFEVGATYPLVIHEERSTNSHNHFFAAVHEAWKNLPEALSRKHPTSEHLRRWALVKAGYADERSIVCDSNAEALKVAAFIKPLDDFCVVVVRDDVVRVFTAKSQSARAMDKKTFQESKTAVLEIVAQLIGVDVDTLSSNTSSSQAHASPGTSETDAPAADHSPLPPAAGQQSESSRAEHADDKGAGDGVSESTAPSPEAEASLLSDDWQEVYLRAMSRVSERPRSLLNRHTEALQMIGGKANASEQEWMRAVYKLTERRLKGEITKAECDEAVREIAG